MKKFLCVFLSAMLCLFSCGAMAETLSDAESMVEMDTEHNAVLLRIPSDWGIAVPEEDIVSELTSGEEDGDTYVQMFSPTGETAGTGTLRFGPEPKQDDGTFTATFDVAEDGSMSYVSLSVHNERNDNPYVSLSEDGTSITVTLRGNPTTGFEWTYYPDNSGTLEGNGGYIPDEAAEGMVGVGGTYTWTFTPCKNAPGNLGSLLFLYERSFEDCAATKLLVNVTLSEDKTTISDFSSDMYYLYQ